MSEGVWQQPFLTLSVNAVGVARFPLLSPAVTSAPLFVTCGDISPRRGENLSRPGEVFPLGGELFRVFRKKKKPLPYGRGGTALAVTERVQSMTFAFCKATKISGMSTSCAAMPGTAVSSAPDKNALNG